jgi:hypothetical protein
MRAGTWKREFVARIDKLTVEIQRKKMGGTQREKEKGAEKRE